MATNENNVSLIEKTACGYCISGDNFGGMSYCHNINSPYHNRERTHVPLSFRQALKGCERIGMFTFQRIDPVVYRQVPKDSYLRDLPLENVVKDYTSGMDLGTETTVDDLASENEQNVGRLIEILQSSPEGLSLDEVRRRMNDTQED